MIFYGTNSSKVLAEQLDRVTCINCNEQSVAMVTFSKYAHVYWIPVFPIGKTTATECINCKQSFVGDAIPEPYKEQVNYQKTKASTPIWHFAGLMVIAAAIIAGVISSYQNDKVIRANVLAPLVGDRYEIKYAPSEYSMWKVTAINADTVYIVPHMYVVNKASGLNKSNFGENTEYDEEEAFSLTTASLLELVEEGKIRDVLR